VEDMLQLFLDALRAGTDRRRAVSRQRRDLPREVNHACQRLGILLLHPWPYAIRRRGQEGALWRTLRRTPGLRKAR
jgi:hypothetical protein